MPAPQGRYFLLTIPQHEFTPYLPESCSYLKGQLECGENTSYLHWQLLVAFPTKVTCTKVKQIFGNSCHVELSRSSAANDYVWKEATRVAGTQFELGRLATHRNDPKDWDKILESAKGGNMSDIPSDVVIRCYTTLKKIHVDNLVPNACVKNVYVYWGATGTGKSRRAWEEATLTGYPKDPCTKWWCGYANHQNVVIDEFRGQIGISHLLRWFDRYPTLVETKGGTCVLSATNFWITSNLSPESWYPDLDQETVSALRRRFTTVVHFNQL